jgi:hypothetical protein
MGRVAAPDGTAIPIIRSLTTRVKHSPWKEWFSDDLLPAFLPLARHYDSYDFQHCHGSAVVAPSIGKMI